MIVSILSRKTAIRNGDEFAKRAGALLGRLRVHLEQQAGFVDVELLGGEGGALAEVTRWQSWDGYRRYVRDGAAASAATIADALLPTAPYPDGAWQRSAYEVVSSD